MHVEFGRAKIYQAVDEFLGGAVAFLMRGIDLIDRKRVRRLDLGLLANPDAYLAAVHDELIDDRLNTEELLRLISLVLAVTVAGEGGDA